MTLEALFDSTSASGVDTFFGTRASYSKAWQAVEGEGKGQKERARFFCFPSPLTPAAQAMLEQEHEGCRGITPGQCEKIRFSFCSRK